MKRGVGTQVQVDATKTALDVADRTLSAMGSDRDVLLQQMKEGAVLAPGAGRVLKTPVTEGSVVLPGETIATIAEDHYILRLQLPERHARFMRAGDVVHIGERGSAARRRVEGREGAHRLSGDPGRPRDRGRRSAGRRRLFRRRANAGLLFRPASGARSSFPRAYVYRRAGVDYARLKDGAEVVVQLGSGERRRRSRSSPGLKDGDEVVTP